MPNSHLRMALRLTAVVPLLLLFTLQGNALAMRQRGPASNVYGRVATLYRNHAQDLVRFDLVQLPSHATLSFRVNSSTSFIPRSAEANVAGFTVHDYAYVSSEGKGRHVAATTVKFDTHPFHIYPSKTVTGIVALTGPHHQVLLRLPDGTNFKFYTVRNTVYSINGQIQETTFRITKSLKLIVTAEHRASRWVATQVDEQT